MNLSFYNGAIGAIMQQEKLNVIANNVANVNTEGFKGSNAIFSNLIYMNMNDTENAATRLKSGSGVKVEKTDTNMQDGSLRQTDSPMDFAIIGDGFFALRNLADNSTMYARNGSFIQSQGANGAFYLASSDGHFVLGKDNNPILLSGTAEEDEFLDEEVQALQNQSLAERIAVYGFDNYNDMVHIGSNRFMPIDKNGYPTLKEDGNLMEGVLELSNVDFAQEMVRMMETQRAYQYALRMVTTSDEIEGTINTLRG